MRLGVIGSSIGVVLLAHQAVAAPINIPTNTWVGVRSPNYYQGACPNGECKHIRVIHNSTDGRIYWLGGDYTSEDGFPQSGTNELWSYSIAGNDWRLEVDYCNPPGFIQPSHPDEVGFAFDPSRNKFWMYPGFQYNPDTQCQSTEVYQKVMSYDVPSRTWAVPNLTWTAYHTRFSQYDAVGDRMLMFDYDGSSILEHNLATNAVRRINTIIPAGEGAGSAFIGWAWTAYDPVGRNIYVVCPSKGQLYRYNLDTNVMKFMCNTPVTGPDEQMLFWDPINHVLLFPFRRDRGTTEIAGPVRLFVWRESAPTTWSEIAITPPVDMQGNPLRDTAGNPVEVKGRVGVFDPIQRVMMITGFDSQDRVPYMFLYRFADGPVDAVPPSAPGNLRPR